MEFQKHASGMPRWFLGFRFWVAVFSHLHLTCLGLFKFVVHVPDEKMRKNGVLVPLLPNKLPQNLWTSNNKHLMFQSFCEWGIVIVTHLGGSALAVRRLPCRYGSGLQSSKNLKTRLLPPHPGWREAKFFRSWSLAFTQCEWLRRERDGWHSVFSDLPLEVTLLSFVQYSVGYKKQIYLVHKQVT